MSNPAEILHQHHLVRTSSREGIIRAMLDAGRPLAEQEIKERIAGNYDRSTFYRAFRVLEEKNIIHKIVVDHLTVIYAIDSGIAETSNHAHFYCEKCNTVACLEDFVVPSPELPDGYKAMNTEMIIRGMCNHCAQSKAV